MATGATLDFEKPIAELERQIDELKRLAGDTAINVDDEIAPLERKLADMRLEIYRNLTPAPARAGGAQQPPAVHARLHPPRLRRLHRAARRPLFRDDAAIVGGWARLDGETVMVIGHQRGRDTKENLHRNFGCRTPRATASRCA
jgi:acetyl-CoA carboxylase carboxyl transferase subunit alpha